MTTERSVNEEKLSARSQPGAPGGRAAELYPPQQRCGGRSRCAPFASTSQQHAQTAGTPGELVREPRRFWVGRAVRAVEKIAIGFGDLLTTARQRARALAASIAIGFGDSAVNARQNFR